MQRLEIPVSKEMTGPGFEVIRENGQVLLRPLAGHAGELLFELSGNGADLAGAEVGARFLDLRGNLAPEKTTAETRHTALGQAAGEASIEWSISRSGPYRAVWTYPQKLSWLDGDPIDRLLLWPEVLEHIDHFPPGTKKVYVRLRSTGPALDNIRLAVLAKGRPPSGRLRITQTWTEEGVMRRHVEMVPANVRVRRFQFAAGDKPQAQALVFEAVQEAIR